MAKRGLSELNADGIRKTPDFNGDEGIFAARAVEQYDEKELKKAQRPRGLRFAVWHQRLSK